MIKEHEVSAERPPFRPATAVAYEQARGPRQAPILGWNLEAIRWARDPVGYLEALHRNYGTFSVWNAERPFRVFAFAPEHNQKVLGNPNLFHIVPQRRRNVIPADSAMMRLRSGLLSLDGEEHRHHRKFMAPAFHHKQVEAYRNTICQMTGRMLDDWPVREARNVEADMRRLVHRIAMKAVLSLDDDGKLNELSGLVEKLLSATPRAMLLPFDLPGSSYRNMMKSADRIEAFLQSLIDEKRSDPSACQDVLAMLMNARNENGVGFKGAELIAEAYNVLCHETSASALVWILFLLAQHPQVYGDLLDELKGELNGVAPDAEQLSRLPLLEHVIKESLRLLPTAPFGTRFSTEACQFETFELPRGAAVTFSQYITHRLPDIYHQPKRFRPRRWETHKPGPYEYFPFGAGAHNCIGWAFAMLEIKIVLAMILQRYRLALIPNTRIDRVFRLSLRPRNGLPMLIENRGRSFSKTQVTGNIHEMVDLT